MFGRRRRRIKKQQNDSPQWVLVKQIAIGLSALLFVGLLGVGVYYGTRIETLQIHTIEVHGGQTISHDALREGVAQALDGTYFFLIPKRFVWLYPHDDIEATVRSYPRVSDEHMERDGDTLSITVEEYWPAGLWCADDSTCVFLDDMGFAYAEAPSLGGNALLRFSRADAAPHVDHAGFDAPFIADAKTFVAIVAKEFDWHITHVMLSTTDDVTFVVAGGGEIRTSLRVGITESLKNLETILQSDEFSHLTPGNFQYVDLRYGNKVFVNEEDATFIHNDAAAAEEAEAAM